MTQAAITCPDCKGAGQWNVAVEDPVVLHKFAPKTVVCTTCHGKRAVRVELESLPQLLPPKRVT